MDGKTGDTQQVRLTGATEQGARRTYDAVSEDTAMKALSTCISASVWPRTGTPWLGSVPREGVMDGQALHAGEALALSP
jgi:hypothetical protein